MSAEFQYKKITKARKRCRGCGKLIQDGEMVRMFIGDQLNIARYSGQPYRKATRGFAHVGCSGVVS